MKKLLSLGVSLALFAATGIAKPISRTTAMTAATSFMESKIGQEAVSLKPFDYYEGQNKEHSELYIFTNSSTPGFVIVAGDDAVKPILGYSLQHSFSESNYPISPELKYWLSTYEVQIDYVLEHQLTATPEISKLWQNLLSGDNNQTAQRGTGVMPLIETIWGQWPYYNKLCPTATVQTGHVPAGCVATSMAQIMKYWDSPTHGTGSHSYSSSTVGGTLSVNFGNTNYNWNNMPNSLTSNSSQTQVNAVATLVYQCGVGVEMDYTTSGSGSYVFTYSNWNNPSAQKAFVNYFGYDPQIEGRLRSQTSSYQWTSLIKGELDNGRPILYSGHDGNGAGHAWVADGYDNSSNVHMNWGWRGLGNGYYDLSDITPSGYGIGAGMGSYNQNQGILINIKPVGTGGPNPGSTSFNLVLNPQSFQASTDSVHFGNNYQFQAAIKNTGTATFPQNDFNIYLVGYKDGNTSQQAITVDQQAHTISAGSTYTYQFNSNSFDELQPGYYVLKFIYTPTNSNQGDPILDDNNRWGGYPLYVLPANNGITEIKGADFSIFPNPANQSVSIKTNDPKTKIQDITLYDISGRMVYKKHQMSNDKIEINTSTFADGMYNLKINTNKGLLQQTLLIRH